MNKIFYVLGKSSSGKDTIYKRLKDRYKEELKEVVPYTTRPIRAGEKDGKDYFFVDEETYLLLKEDNKVIEDRVYNTIHGPWRYFTVEDDQFSDDVNKLMIGVLNSYISVRNYYGEERVIPIYIEVEDGLRLQRALDRERKQDIPKYKELCRRFLADSEDFEEEKIIAAGIGKRFINDNLEDCVREIVDYIDSFRRN